MSNIGYSSTYQHGGKLLRVKSQWHKWQILEYRLTSSLHIYVNILLISGEIDRARMHNGWWNTTCILLRSNLWKIKAYHFDICWTHFNDPTNFVCDERYACFLLVINFWCWFLRCWQISPTLVRPLSNFTLLLTSFHGLPREPTHIDVIFYGGRSSISNLTIDYGDEHTEVYTDDQVHSLTYQQ